MARRNPIAKSLRIMGKPQVIEDRRAKLLANAERREGEGQSPDRP